MKKLLWLVLLAGCGAHVTPADMERYKTFCVLHGGLSFAVVDDTDHPIAVCGDHVKLKMIFPIQ